MASGQQQGADGLGRQRRRISTLFIRRMRGLSLGPVAATGRIGRPAGAALQQ